MPRAFASYGPIQSSVSGMIHGRISLDTTKPSAMPLISALATERVKPDLVAFVLAAIPAAVWVVDVLRGQKEVDLESAAGVVLAAAALTVTAWRGFAARRTIERAKKRQ